MLCLEYLNRMITIYESVTDYDLHCIVYCLTLKGQILPSTELYPAIYNGSLKHFRNHNSFHKNIAFRSYHVFVPFFASPFTPS